MILAWVSLSPVYGQTSHSVVGNGEGGSARKPPPAGRGQTPPADNAGVATTQRSVNAVERIAAPRAQADPHNLFRVGTKRMFAISLAEAVEMAVSNNLDIAAAGFDPLISQSDEDSALAAFDPLYFANFTITDSETPTSSSLSGAANLTQRQTHFDSGIRKQLFSGGSYELRFDADRSKSNSMFAQLNPSFTSNLTAQATQPLLRGLGVRRNLSTWKTARNATASARAGEEDTVAGVVGAVQKGYWDLVFALGDLEVRNLSLKRAQQLLKENRERLAVGSITELDVISAQVDVAGREEDVITAEQRVKDAEDSLKLQIRPLDHEFLEAVDLKPTTMPQTDVPEIDYLALLRRALADRWNIVQSRLDLANRNIRVQDAEHDLLPRLDLQASIALNALNNHLDTVIDDLDNGDFQTWNLGLTFEVPIGNRQAKAALRKAQLEMRQALVRHRALEDSVLQEVRGALRSLATTARTLVTVRQAREFAAAQLEKEEARYTEGLSTAFQVLDFQEDLATAESNELLALTNLEKALVDIDLATGEILEKLGVEREGDPQTGTYYSRFGDLVDPAGK